MDFRTRLREQIEYLGLLDKEVAAKAGITKRALDSYVGSQNCMPSADIAVKLAKALNVSVEYLVTGKDTSTPSLTQYTPEIRHLADKLQTMTPRDLKNITALIDSICE